MVCTNLNLVGQLTNSWQLLGLSPRLSWPRIISLSKLLLDFKTSRHNSMNGFLCPICNFSFTPLSSWEKTSNTILDVSVVADWWKSSSPFVTSCSSPTSLKRFQIQEYNCPLATWKLLWRLHCTNVLFLFQSWKASSNCFWKSVFVFLASPITLRKLKYRLTKDEFTLFPCGIFP